MTIPSPAPTSPPDPRAVAFRLRERQATTATTCGWVDGDYASPVTCSSDYTCISSTSQNIHGCCPDLFECFPPTTCLDSTAVITACNNTCQADLSTLKCTSDTNTYCYSETWGDGMSQFGCAPSAYYQTVQITHDAESYSTAPSQTLSQSGSSTSTLPATSSGSAANSQATLSTAEIIGIAVGSFVFLVLGLAYLRRLCQPSGGASRNDGEMDTTTYIDPRNKSPTLPPYSELGLGSSGIRHGELGPDDSASHIGASDIGSPIHEYSLQPIRPTPSSVLSNSRHPQSDLTGFSSNPPFPSSHR